MTVGMSSAFLATYIALWVLVLLFAAALVAVYQHLADTYISSREGRLSQGPAAAEPLRPSVGSLLGGGEMALPRIGNPTVVVFAETTCEICGELRADFQKFASEPHDSELVVVCGAPDRGAVADWASDLPDVAVVADIKRKLTNLYEVVMTPFVVVVDAKGVVRGKGLLNDYEGIAAYGNFVAAYSASPATV